MTPSDQMVEAGARAEWNLTEDQWAALPPTVRALRCDTFRIGLTAALALAEAEGGAVLCVVPGEAHTVTTPDPPDWLAKTANNPHEAVVSWDLGHGAGHNDCRAATLAGRVWP